jgi:hypothetical protein
MTATRTILASNEAARKSVVDFTRTKGVAGS